MPDINTRINRYFTLLPVVIFLYGLAYILISAGIVRYPYPDWWIYPTTILSSLLVPVLYGHLFAFPAQWLAKRRPAWGYAFFWTAALLGATVVPGYFWLSRALSRMDCGNTCVGVPSDAAWVAMASVSIILAVATPLLVAYYKQLNRLEIREGYKLAKLKQGLKK